jgi:hypothetical protein
VRGLDTELRTVAGLTGDRPAGDGRNLLGGRPGTDLQLELIFALIDLMDALHADVIGATLEHGEGHGSVEMLHEEGEILVGQLVLERLGGSGDNDTTARDDGGDEIGEGLARAGSGLDHEMSTIGDRPRDRLCHLDLPGTWFAGRQCVGDGSECPCGVGDEPIGGCHWMADGTGGVGPRR